MTMESTLPAGLPDRNPKALPSIDEFAGAAELERVLDVLFGDCSNEPVERFCQLFQSQTETERAILRRVGERLIQRLDDETEKQRVRACLLGTLSTEKKE